MQKFITVIILFISLFSFSQNKSAIFGGINNSTLSDGFLEKVPIGQSFGLHIGWLYQYQFHDKIAFRPKVMISSQGDREETDRNFIDASSIDYKLLYLNIPLNFKFFSRPYALVGPQVGLLMSTEKGKMNFGEVKTSFDYGLNLGIGYDINKLFVEINLYQGFPTLVEIEDISGFSVGVDASNTVFQLSLGYYLD